MSWRRIVTLLAFAIAILAVTREAGAIPAFARRYGTSCQTCHMPFPRLNPFGDAFRRNGYRYPAGEDEDSVKESSIPMGQEAHKKLFPHEVWPSELPANIPMAVVASGQMAFDPDPPTDDDPEASFADLGGTLGLRFATAFDDTFSVWAAGELRATQSGGAEAALERVFLFVKPFDDPVLDLRVGRFEPALLNVSMHRTLGFAPWITTTKVKDDPFTLEPAQVGLEASGVAGSGRLTYAAGIVEGGGDRINADKDVYSRIAVKIGGMRLDGVGGPADSIPWRETSLQLGVFGYFGRAALGDPAVASQEDGFVLAGGDVGLAWRDLTLLGAVGFGRNARPSLADPYTATSSYHVLVQADYVMHPFVVPTVRYERRGVGDDDGDRISGGLYVLWRANIRSQVLLSGERAHGEAFALGQILVGLNTAF